MATSLATAPATTTTPGPRTWVPGGAYWAFRKDPLAFFTQTARTYGDVAAFSFGPQKVYLLSHPDLIERVLLAPAHQFGKGVALERAKKLLGNGLLTSAGAEHLKQRRTIQPLFHRQHVQGFAAAMVRHASRWNDTITPGARIDVTAEMGALTLAIVGETLFSSNVQSDADEVRAALADAVSGFSSAFIPMFEYLEKLPLPMFIRVRKARARLDRVIHRVIADRRASEEIDQPEGVSPQRHDLLSMLLAARDPENPNAAGMSDQQIRDEAMTIFLAGHETTANAMSWTWHLLGLASEVESLLHAELSQVLGGRTASVEDVPKLEWTRAIVAESMRLYPPAWTMGRRVLETQTIGGHRIEKGALVIFSQYVVHRDPRWWVAPEAFRPSRWLPASTSSSRPKYAYFPFGGGSRICIGESFAWTEAILLLATIAQRWRFTPTADPDPVPEPRITLRPRGLFMQAAAR